MGDTAGPGYVSRFKERAIIIGRFKKERDTGRVQPPHPIANARQVSPWSRVKTNDVKGFCHLGPPKQ
jgi:hypothetical protein